jgi:hypothetical protein
MNWSDTKSRRKTASSIIYSPTSWFSTSNSRAVLYGVVVLVLGIRLVWITSPGPSLAPNTNRLIFGENAPPGPVSIDIAPITDLPVQGAAVLDLRRQRAALVSKHITQPYEPSQVVFSRIKDNTPWVTMQQFFGRGASTVVEPAGAKFEAQGVLNPLLLVEPVFFEPSAQGTMLVLPSASGRFQPELSSMTFDGVHAEIRYTFLLSSFLNLSSRPPESGVSEPIPFSISLYNARDFGFIKWTFDEQASQNVTAPLAGEHKIIDHLRTRTDLCLTETGCNHRSPSPASQLGFGISDVPAQAVFKLTQKNREGEPERFIHCIVSFL